MAGHENDRGGLGPAGHQRLQVQPALTGQTHIGHQATGDVRRDGLQEVGDAAVGPDLQADRADQILDRVSQRWIVLDQQNTARTHGLPKASRSANRYQSMGSPSERIGQSASGSIVGGTPPRRISALHKSSRGGKSECWLSMSFPIRLKASALRRPSSIAGARASCANSGSVWRWTAWASAPSKSCSASAPATPTARSRCALAYRYRP